MVLREGFFFPLNDSRAVPFAECAIAWYNGMLPELGDEQMGVTVSGLTCRFQDKVTTSDAAEALHMAQCHHCGVTTRELMAMGELLEVCGEVYATDLATGERVLSTIPLCPDCHRKFHLDAKRRHNPCQVSAGNSRDGLE